MSTKPRPASIKQHREAPASKATPSEQRPRKALKRQAIQDPSAYEYSVDPYRVGTRSAMVMLDFLLAYLEPAKRARYRYVYRYGGMCGTVSPRPDGDKKGLVGFAFYQRRNPHSPFKRNRDHYPLSTRQGFEWLTLPEVFAHVFGEVMHRLEPREFARWSHELQQAAGLTRKFTFTELLDPDSEEADEWRCVWKVIAIGRSDGRLQRHSRRLERRAYALYMRVLVPDWIESAKHSSNSLPKPIERSDTYLAQRLNGMGFSTNRREIRKSMQLLDTAGYVKAVGIVGEEFAAGKRTRAGHYLYLPGDGVPPPSPTRRQDLSHLDTLRAQRLYEESELVETKEQQDASERRRRQQQEQQQPFAEDEDEDEKLVPPVIVDDALIERNTPRNRSRKEQT